MFTVFVPSYINRDEKRIDEVHIPLGVYASRAGAIKAILKYLYENEIILDTYGKDESVEVERERLGVLLKEEKIKMTETELADYVTKYSEDFEGTWTYGIDKLVIEP